MGLYSSIGCEAHIKETTKCDLHSQEWCDAEIRLLIWLDSVWTSDLLVTVSINKQVMNSRYANDITDIVLNISLYDIG